MPAITYGVPDVAPDDPSPLSFKLAESNVILEFIADLYPEAGLLPADPVQRAKVRFFMQIVGSKFFSHFDKWVDEGDPQARVALLEGIEFIQGLLPDSGAPKFAVGDCYTLADACITPFIQQLQICIEYDYGEFPAGDGPKLGETLKGPKYAKFMAYGLVATGRDIAKQLYNPVSAKWGVWPIHDNDHCWMP